MSMTTITVDLPNDVLLRLSLQAHSRGITLNDLIVEILEDYIAINEPTDNIDENFIQPVTDENFKDDELDNGNKPLANELRTSYQTLCKELGIVDPHSDAVIKSISNYSYAFCRWFEEYSGMNTFSDIVKGNDD